MIKYYQPLVYPHNPLSHAVFLNGLSSVVIAIAVWILQHVLGLVHWSTVTAMLIIGVVMSFANWGAERLWYSIIAGMMREPLSLVGFATRIPFLYVASGIGYVICMLAAKKNGLIEFYDIPARTLFIVGARLGIVVWLSLQFLSNYVITKKSKRGLEL